MTVVGSAIVTKVMFCTAGRNRVTVAVGTVSRCRVTVADSIGVVSRSQVTVAVAVDAVI